MFQQFEIKLTLVKEDQQLHDELQIIFDDFFTLLYENVGMVESFHRTLVSKSNQFDYHDSTSVITSVLGNHEYPCKIKAFDCNREYVTMKDIYRIAIDTDCETTLTEIRKKRELSTFLEELDKF